MTITISFWQMYFAIVVCIGIYGFFRLNNSEGLGGMFYSLYIILAIILAIVGVLAMLFG